MHLYQQVSDQNHYYEGVRSLEEEVCQFNIRFICCKNSYFISESFSFFFVRLWRSIVKTVSHPLIGLVLTSS